MRRLCTVCARGGSKGVADKNLMPVAGKPLLAHSLEQARGSGLFAAIAVSSDSPRILEAAERWGADLLVERPAELATDVAPKLPAIQHAVEWAERITGDRFETLVDLDATSPLRRVDDVRAAVELLESSGVSQVITGTPARRSPYFNMVEVGADGAVRLVKEAMPGLVRRQDAPACFDMNASIYVWSRDGLFHRSHPFNPDVRLFVMPEERSIDVDSPLDARIVRFLMESDGR
jgi:N-acylneuraminate cytidylyltransferase/CMP-N,N'-diacetyllegionaminic acid synthase